jgi:uncharacterized RDD family membrane protein YckC
MSDPGNPPQDPHAQPNPYGGGQPGPNPYGQPNPYGGPPTPYSQQPAYGYGQPQGQPGYGAPAAGYAHWIKRVGAFLIDYVALLVAGLPLWIGYGIVAANTTTTTNADGTTTTTGDVGTAPVVLFIVGAITYLAFFIWNVCVRQGRTGYSVGKQALGIKLIGLRSGQPIGGGLSFIRQLAHILDVLPCYIGYLWPLWDPKRQTFSDKVCSTVVLNEPKR